MIRSALDDAIDVKQRLRQQADQIQRSAEVIARAFQAGNRLYACGNGGSACDAMHLVEELVARYRRERPGLPAHHLLDAPTLTCWSNDYDFASVFERQVDTLVRRGDVLVAISTSGNSPNIVAAAQAARRQGAVVIGLLGKNGGHMAELCDELLVVPGHATERIQEAHITVIHLWCELLERMLFPEAV